ncbi:hypothetical protein DL95DRAFT_470514 [Leptodontidium sp. 2 PMI_412]|nr:hypothetical protein DL95DRAFT_470514 [Leptodontidium sp. 2 PMI_412]
MYGLQPAVDFVDMSAKGATRYLSHYTKDFKIPLEENQICDTMLPPVNDFVGSYITDHLDIICLDISVNTKDASRLTMVVNKQSDQAWEMWHYNYDTWYYLPDSYDNCLIRGLDRTLWSSFLISFRRDSAEKINGLFWKLDSMDLQATLGSLFERASAATDQSQRDWFFDTEAQNANACNYDRYGSPNLRNLEQRFLSVLGLGDRTPMELLLTSSGMAAYQVIQNYLLQILAPNDIVVLPPYIYFEALEQLQGLKHLCIVHAPTSAVQDIIETAERYNARAVFIDPVANLVTLSVSDVRQFARTVSNQPGWGSRYVIIDGTIASGAMNIYDWFYGAHAPKVFYYESASPAIWIGSSDGRSVGVPVCFRQGDAHDRSQLRGSHVLPQRSASTATRLLHVPGTYVSADIEFREVLGWRHGSALVTIRFCRDGMNNKEGLEACIGLILHAAQTLGVPLTKGVSFGFSTSRISSASSMAQGSDPFLRTSVGLDMAQIDDLAEAILTGVKRYVADFDGTQEAGSDSHGFSK